MLVLHQAIPVILASVSRAPQAPAPQNNKYLGKLQLSTLAAPLPRTDPFATSTRKYREVKQDNISAL